MVDTFGPRGERPALVPVPPRGAPTTRHDPAGLGDPLGTIVTILERDGFVPTWDVDASGGVTFRISAGSAACGECMVPRSVIEALLTDALAATPYRVVEVVMPTDV